MINIYTHARRDQPKVALTFDDGPNPPRTDQILDILAAHNALATFFVIGKWIDRWPRAFERIVQAGHTIGNHSYRHDPDLGDFDRAEAVISNVTGRASRFVRAHFFNFHLCQESPLASSGDVKVVDADVNPADYSRTDPDEIHRLIMESPDLGAGSVIDLHDGAESENHAVRLSRPLPLIEALPGIIERLQARELELVGLDDMELVEPKPWPQQT